MPVRGEPHLRAIRLVLDTFGEDAKSFVFIGGCVLALYAREEGPAFRATKDVDCLSLVTPWVIQEQRLARMCQSGTLSPDPDLQCRYRVTGTDLEVDVLSPDGFNVGGANHWLKRAADHAAPFEIGGGRIVQAITPPYFLATKLEAFADRGPDAMSSKDAEDIIAMLVEVADVVAQVNTAGLTDDVAALWRAALAKHGVSTDTLPDLIDWHLDQRDREHHGRVLRALRELVGLAR